MLMQAEQTVLHRALPLCENHAAGQKTTRRRGKKASSVDPEVDVLGDAMDIVSNDNDAGAAAGEASAASAEANAQQAPISNPAPPYSSTQSAPPAEVKAHVQPRLRRAHPLRPHLPSLLSTDRITLPLRRCLGPSPRS